MAKAKDEGENFKFLIACIRNSNNGKVNFQAVAEECNIVTRGAAAKRYERLMKAHGIHQPQGPTGRDTGVQPLRPRTAAAEKNREPPSKKRKRNASKGNDETVKMEELHDDDADEGHQSSVEKAAGHGIKLEAESALDQETSDAYQLGDNASGGMGYDGAADSDGDFDEDLAEFDADEAAMIAFG